MVVTGGEVLVPVPMLIVVLGVVLVASAVTLALPNVTDAYEYEPPCMLARSGVKEVCVLLTETVT